MTVLEPLADRTFSFAKRVMAFTRLLPRSLENSIVLRQVIRSATSVGANYLEANESLSKKDFVHRIRIARKEARETEYWLRLLELDHDPLHKERDCLQDEARQLVKIMHSIYEKSKHSTPSLSRTDI